MMVGDLTVNIVKYQNPLMLALYAYQCCLPVGIQGYDVMV